MRRPTAQRSSSRRRRSWRPPLTQTRSTTSTRARRHDNDARDHRDDGGNGAFPAFFDGNSADGTRVFFSTSEKLENPPDSDSSLDVYERFSSGLTAISSIGPSGGNGAIGAFYDDISADGTNVFFHTSEKLVNPPDTDNSTDIYNASAATGYARPKGASPINIRLVPAFAQCSGASPAGMTHGAPLAVPSCSPPDEASNHLTIGAPDHTGTPALRPAW